ncbi:MAG: aldose epimerase, partial [Spartobacteria bacterium]|nr:aldose epimerase [Spartobacteria bacterium]
YNNQLYKLPIHGFASRMPWEAKDQGDTLLLTLRDTPETRAVYPFAFAVTLAYQVTRNTFICKQTYANTGDRAMPYYAGFHPYFLTPPPGAPKGGVELSMQPLRQISYNRDYTEVKAVTDPRSFPVGINDPHLNENGFYGPDAARGSLRFPDATELFIAENPLNAKPLFPYMHVYTKPKEPFFCIEPWMGLPNGLNTIDGCRWLPPGEKESAEIHVWIE